jgi:hypothetical protein
MKRWLLSVVTAGGALMLGACGGAEVVVQAQLEGEGGAEGRPIGELEVRALPYDREVIFDSLKAAHGQPEPEVPDSLLQLQGQIAAAQQQWQQAEARWNTARDSLRGIRERLDRLPRNSPQYRLLFADFGVQETAERTAQRQSQEAFGRYDNLLKRFASQAEELRVRRDLWADEAYASVDEVIAARLKELGREVSTDTTNASGIIRFKLKPGQWWINAFYDLPYEELYWNVPVEVQRGDPTQVVLNRASAQSRPKL